MILLVWEYDVGGSFHLSNAPTCQQDSASMHLEGMNYKGREAPTLSF
jgi:hypothetical protein